MSDLTCRKCGKEMTPIMFKEEEYATEYGMSYKTGRYRRACNYLVCEHCGNKECVDDDFMAGPWIMEKG